MESEQIRKQTIEELQKSADALVSELQEKIKAMGANEAELQDKVTELTSELEAYKQSYDSASSGTLTNGFKLQNIKRNLKYYRK